VDAGRLPIEVLFYGSFLSLQGPEVIIEAANEIKNKEIQWVLLGDGDLRSRLETRAQGMANVRFEPWTPYEDLPSRLAQAHILLGIFGTTPKAAMVIPNKVFQAMAMGRPLITRYSEAYPQQVRDSTVIGWVPAGDASALAAQVEKMAADPHGLVGWGHQTRQLYEQCLSLHHIRRQLQNTLDKVMHYF
jgi:glycosyltransferase involved in cell wall biosynthesis